MALFTYLLALLMTSCGTASLCLPELLELPKPHFIIVGMTGAGKSSLAQALIGGNVTCGKECAFPICEGMDSCTKNTTYVASPWLGDIDMDNTTVVDTPGFDDSDGEEDVLLEEMINVLNEDVKTADAIILAIDANSPRFNDAVVKMLDKLESLFGQKMWNDTIITITKFSYSQAEIDFRRTNCELRPNECKDEEYYDNQVNEQIEKNFHIGMKLPIVFIDSWSQKPEFKMDTMQQYHFGVETQKVWSFGRNTTEFQFKTIDEVLEENAQMQKELDTLSKSMMPVGSITAWVPTLGSQGGDEVELPEGWQLCNGTIITKGPWKDKKTPNLNGEKRFLRGGNKDSLLKQQDDAIQFIEIEDHGHHHTQNTHTHNQGKIYTCTDSGGGAYSKLSKDYHHNCGEWTNSNSESLPLIHASKSYTKLTEYRKDDDADETRPINTSILWIIRVV